MGLHHGQGLDEDFSYVNKAYQKDFKKGDKVLALDKEGIAIGGTNYVHVKHEDGSIEAYHPQDVEKITQKEDSVKGGSE